MKKLIIGACLSVLLLSACNREEGVGGKASITGKVLLVQLTEVDEDTVDMYYIPEERVYIIYGDHQIYDDDMRTNFDGSYKFDYLRKGDYTVFAYSEVYENRDDYRKIDVPVFQKVTIDKKKDDIVVPDIIINEYVNY